MVKCDNCGKKIRFFSYRGCDIKGKLLCESCWKQLPDKEKDLMFNIKTKKAYEKNKAKLLKEANSFKLNLKRKEPKIKDEKYCFEAILAAFFTFLLFILSIKFGHHSALLYIMSLALAISALKKFKENPNLKGKFLAWSVILWGPILLLFGLILQLISLIFK